ncbi:hypothetical protein ISF_00327 [Cordyceps fumosorosea ARSEF 2679]|uniref:Helix-turn-helix domain-containing protein n=1 Tax=Cordyceps fumosorosea (strain ARSEF 2679) TaxID=1081104 RepID=A0A168E695_CORFA|nr:hypothetical protein ISF_00327 [Cordyceps fumosorosea ARSEF 2679]OAA73426.1 hypothetical protein ISF_00327 [Cordyceps fumosorosea ARSEF 2679]
MGSASSKAARSAPRKFPARSAGSAVAQTTSRPPRASPQPSAASDLSPDQETISRAADPEFTPAGFASRLQQMGIVDPNPTYSPSSRAADAHRELPSAAPGRPIFPSSRANTTLTALEARRRAQERAEEDEERFLRVGMRGAARRQVDARTLADALRMVDAGAAPRDVEARMGMREGLLGRTGRKGVLTLLTT